MPLSDHEQRQLEQIEQALYADDPRLARAVRAKDPRVHYRRKMVQAVLGLLVGVGLVVAGVITKIIPIGVGGFVIMLVCALWALANWRHMGGVAASRRFAVGRAPVGVRGPGRGPARSPSRKRPGGRSGQGFMERLEERWRRRQEGHR